MSGSTVKDHSPSGRPPRLSVTAPLAATGNSAEAIPGAASLRAAGSAPPETVSSMPKRSGSP